MASKRMLSISPTIWVLNVDLNETSSRGGTFIGVEPMVLIWSMVYLNANKFVQNKHKLRLRETSKSHEVAFSLFAGHEKPPATPKDIKQNFRVLITQATVERLVCVSNV